MPKTEKNFDKAAYDKEFQRKNYYRLNIVLKKDLREKIDQAAAAAGVSKNAFITAAILEKIEKQ